MDRRWNLLFLVPLLAALVAYFLTQQLIFTAVAFVLGYLLMEGMRFALLPPNLHRAARQYQKGNLELALELTEKAVAARPDRWESYYLRALIHFSSARLEAAEQSARQATELKPDEVAAHLVLGQILFAQGRYHDAQESFLAALARGGRSGIHQYHAASTAYRLGVCENAIPRLELALRLGIDNGQLRLLATYYLADCLRRTGKEEEAAPYFTKVTSYASELESLRQDLRIVPDYPERAALGKDLQAIAKLIEEERAKNA